MTAITARRQLRLVTSAVLTIITGVTVDSPGDWLIKPSRLPNIKLQAPNEHKTATAKGMPTFTTTVTLQILATLQAPTAELAQDQADALVELIEAAFFSAQPIVKLLQQIPSVSTEIKISAEGEQHVAQILMNVDCETFESFDPTRINPADYPALDGLDLHLDLMRPFDPTGTYADLAFADSVDQAPRTSGPDGHDEAVLNIDLSAPPVVPAGTVASDDALVVIDNMKVVLL